MRIAVGDMYSNVQNGIGNQMVEILGLCGRERLSETIIRSNEFAYRLIPDYAELPDNLRYSPIPSGCCDEEGNLYLACRNPDHPILVLDSQGHYCRSFGKGDFRNIHSIRFTSKNNLLCVDSQLHQVLEFTLAGEKVRTIGSGIPSDSGFEPNVWRKKQASGEMIPNDVLFDSQWAFIEGLSTIKRAAPPFNMPTGVAESKDGKLFFSDGYANAAVHRFSADGILEKTWGGPGKGPGKFTVPHGIHVDGKNQVWVADREGNCVHVFDEDGKLLAYVYENLYQPSEICGDQDHIYIGERGGGLTIMNSNFEIEAQLGFYTSSLMMHGICIDSEGNLYLMPLASYYPHAVMKLERCK